MELGLQGKVAMVTGGAMGIGKAIGFALVREGVSIAICDIDQEAMEQTGEEIQTTTEAKVLTLYTDTTKVDDIAKSVKQIVKTFGRLDILVNNAGASPPGWVTEVSHEDWASAFDIKFLGYVRCAKEVFPHMMRQKWGRIINLIGAGGREVAPMFGTGAANNAALTATTKYLAVEGAKYNILVNGINPGMVGPTRKLNGLFKMMASRSGITPEQAQEEMLSQVPLGRFCQPEEVADLAVFLASERAGYITGSIVTIDGCFTRGIM